MITLLEPVWLVLFLPLAVVLMLWRMPTRSLAVLRAVALAMIVLGMTRPVVRLAERAGMVIVVADRSESMPPNAAAVQKEIIELLQKSMGPRNMLGVVAFGRRAVVECAPQQGGFHGFNADVGPEQSCLAEAIETALDLVPLGTGARLLVLSDGKWTGRDPVTAAARAAGRGIPIDYRLLTRPQAGDVAIQSFQVPDVAQPGQGILLTAWVSAPAEQEVRYQLRRGEKIIASGTRRVDAGLTRLMFRDRAPEAGICEYKLTVEPAEPEPVPENNTARALLTVRGAARVLVVSETGPGSGLARLLQAGGLNVTARMPEQCMWTLEELAQFNAVVLENVPAGKVGSTGLETLAAWVEETGAGLMLTGGRKAYGPGGYYKSPLERVLPVSMELRKEHRKFSLAIVVALDRSGSMAEPVAGGKVKMDLANLGTVQVLDMLGPTDEFGVIAVDSSAHVIVPLDTVENNAAMRGKILSIGSMGGGIFIYEALSAAVRMILRARAGTRHIILFADAADAEEPGQYRELLEKCRQAGITVSVIGLGTEADVDADLLKDIARRGGGECYFTADAREIPRLFAQDTFTVARSAFVEESTQFQFTPAWAMLGSPPAAEPPALGGYNLCYLKPEANQAAVTIDEYNAPVVAFWNAGAGRVLCFTGEADGKYAGPLAAWAHAGEFWSTLVRWVAGRDRELPSELMLVQQIRDGACVVELHLDPGRKAEPFTGTPRIRTLHGQPGTTPEKLETPMEWVSPDLLQATIPIAGTETVLNTVEIPGLNPVTLPPVCLPYSPEFAPEQPGRGAAALAQLAAATGGRERIQLPGIWAELPVQKRFVELTPWLLLSAVLVFLVEVLERRTGLALAWMLHLTARLFGVRAKRKPVATPQAEGQPAEARPARVDRARPRTAAPTPQPARAQSGPQPPRVETSAPVQPDSAQAGAQSTFDAFREARERARRRTQ